MWYRAIYFDGDKVCSKFLDRGERTFKIKVKSGGLRPIVVIPLDTLSPLGGFYSDGYDHDIELLSENGSFAYLLIEAANERKACVSNLSLEWLLSSGYELGTIDQSSFLESLFDGTLEKDGVKNAPYFHPQIEGIPEGYWISDSVKADSFVFSNVDKLELNLFAGVYNYWNKERDLLLTIVIAEDGRFYNSIERIPDLC